MWSVCFLHYVMWCGVNSLCLLLMLLLLHFPRCCCCFIFLVVTVVCIVVVVFAHFADEFDVVFVTCC